MKNKLIAVSLLMVAVAILVRVGIVRANIKTITEVCKTNGGILMARENCPGDAEKWTLGSGNEGSTLGGGVAFMFMNGSEPTVLKENGQVWRFSHMYGEWVPDTDLNMTITSELVSQIFQWYGRSFITKTGVVYIFENQAWIEKPIPIQ